MDERNKLCTCSYMLSTYIVLHFSQTKMNLFIYATILNHLFQPILVHNSLLKSIIIDFQRGRVSRSLTAPDS